jgi:predicted nucleic acid-binding protein
MAEWKQQNRHVVTTNYVLSELVVLLTSPLRMPRSKVLRYIETIRAIRWVEIVHINPTLDEAAWELLAGRSDKEWSLVDCASFVVMKQRNLTDALTADKHFEQAGFVRLLR